MKKKISLMLVVFILLSIFLPACGGEKSGEGEVGAGDQTVDKDPPKDNNGKTGEKDRDEPGEATLEYKQAPMLDSKDLPPIEERLPNEPKFTNEMPPELLDYEIGKYGGVLRTVTSVIEWDADVFVMNNEALLNTPGILGEEITGNILKGYEVSDDQKEFTFYMREGLKWSDGEQVTVEDVRFTVEDVLFDEELTPIFPALFRAGGSNDGEPVDFEIVDDFCFKLKFTEPYGGLPIRLSIQGWRGYTELLKPAHYLKQFHKKYNTDEEEMEKLIKEAGFEPGEWENLFHDKDITNWELTNSKAIGFPVLYPWKYVEKTDTMAVFERNPYYFKIDEEGNQLPYIDRIESSLVQDIEMVTMKTISGEVDFCRESAALIKMPLYKENESNGYKALLANMHVTPTDIFINQTYDDPGWQEVVQDVRFRKALSLATDRDEIIDAIYYGFADPGTMMDSTYDLDEANRLLDDMGMAKGSNGLRNAPSGKKFSLLIEVGAEAPDIVPLAELLVEQWKGLDIDVSMKRIDTSLRGNKLAANELQCFIIWTHTPLWYMADWGMNHWGRAWWRWWETNGEQGEEPPEDVKEFYEMVRDVSVLSPEEGMKKTEEIKKNMGENYWYLVHVENVKQPLIVNEKLGNVSDKGFAIAANFSGEQFFFKD